MLSSLLLILKYIAIIASIALFLIFFVPLIVKWVGWAFTTAYAIIASVPAWFGGIFLIAVALSLVGLAVKLL